jgi:hypothetical protein
VASDISELVPGERVTVEELITTLEWLGEQQIRLKRAEWLD